MKNIKKNKLQCNNAKTICSFFVYRYDTKYTVTYFRNHVQSEIQTIIVGESDIPY